MIYRGTEVIFQTEEGSIYVTLTGLDGSTMKVPIKDMTRFINSTKPSRLNTLSSKKSSLRSKHTESMGRKKISRKTNPTKRREFDMTLGELASKIGRRELIAKLRKNKEG